jgi:DNA-binding transcriptional ArsR family regulator
VPEHGWASRGVLTVGAAHSRLPAQNWSILEIDRILRLLRERRRSDPASDPYAHLVRVHASPCYDFLVSLRALFNPRTYESTRAWAAAARTRLPVTVRERGRFFFQGHDTSLGYGVARFVPGLPEDATPSTLVEAVRAADPRVLALSMLDTGETSEEALHTFERALRGGASAAALDRALSSESPDWARRCRRVLTEPEAAQSELVLLLADYLSLVFEAEVPHVASAIARGAGRAEELLSLLPTATAIDQLAGGYTLSPGLALRRITLAPSAFIYPYMASRVDERTGEALIVFGVRSEAFVRFETVPLDPELVRAVRALADPGRLKVMRLLSRQPMAGPDLVSALGLSAPTVHHHLHQLRAAGLVRQERVKGGMQYTVRRDSATDLLDALSRLILSHD